MEERNPMEEQVEKEENSNQPESRMGKHNKRKVTVNTNGLFKIVITLLVVASLGMNVFLFTKVNKSSSSGSSSNKNTTVENVNYDVKSSTTDVIEKVNSSVVGVLVYANGTASGSGSGVVYRVDGKTAYIITNAHVVSGATDVQVVFSNKESVNATIVGSDTYSDIAVLKLTADFDMTAIKCGDSSLLDQGETVLAIGSPLGIEYAGTVTQGIVSGIDRTVSVDLNDDGQEDWDMNVIQTDAAINPGNSGGALLNANGEVIGINSAKINSSAVEGMGFAIPISDASDVIQNLMNKETRSKVSDEERGYLGIKGYDVSEEGAQMYNMPTGVYVKEVMSGGGAEKAGLTKGSIITGFEGSSISGMSSLQEQLQYYKAGEEVTLTVQIPDKNGEYTEKDIKVTLGKNS